MDSPLTLRLDKETRERLVQIARQKKVSTSEVIREAIEAWMEGHESIAMPYDSATDLIGVVHGGNPRRSTQTGRQLRELLKRGRNRS